MYNLQQSQHFVAMAPRLDVSLPCGPAQRGAEKHEVWGNTCNVQGAAIEQFSKTVCGTQRELHLVPIFLMYRLCYLWVVALSWSYHGGKQFSFSPQTKAHVESRRISKPNLVLRSYKMRPCEGLLILPSRIWIFGESCVFFYCMRMDVSYTRSMYINAFAIVCTWF